MLAASKLSIHPSITNLSLPSLSPRVLLRCTSLFLTRAHDSRLIVPAAGIDRSMGEEDGAGAGAGAGDVVVVDPPHVVVCKGKRSKRQRVHASPATVIAASAADVVESSSSDQEAASGCVTEEEEDMALCLMLLARGGGRAGSSSLAVVAPDAADSTASVAAAKEGKFRSRRPADGAGADGEFVYECKTCGRCFPSFQALGGHRTSHKKPRLLLPPTATTTSTTTEEKKQRPALAEEKPSPRPTDDPIVIAIPAVPATPPKQESAAATSGASRQPQQHKLGSSRVHECSICGAEFASGQALGGHMRRHRPLVPASAASSDDDVGAAAAAAVIGGKEKSLLLELDLNMPAPCDDATSLPSPAAILFRGAPASALVDCHY